MYHILTVFRSIIVYHIELKWERRDRQKQNQTRLYFIVISSFIPKALFLYRKYNKRLSYINNCGPGMGVIRAKMGAEQVTDLLDILPDPLKDIGFVCDVGDTTM